MIERQYSFEQKPVAFRTELYENATKSQIKDDVISYLGEYRFKVPEFDYKLVILEGRLVDPNSLESMTTKASKAVDEKRKAGQSSKREEAEFLGLSSIESRLRENPQGTVLWLSPPGAKEDGYGDYGFAFVGKKDGQELKMTALRLETPTLEDFNKVSKTLSGQTFDSPEGFLQNPIVLDITKEKIRDFVLGTFQISDEENKSVFDKAVGKMEVDGILETFARIIKNGSSLQKLQAVNAIENLAIELEEKYKKIESFVLVYDPPVDFSKVMLMQKYNSTPPIVAGSCGMTGKVETSNVLGKLTSTNTLKKESKEWFSCPKCKYKADGPVGDTCPGCGLTKDQYVKQGGKAC